MYHTFFIVAKSVNSDSREKGETVPLTIALILSWWLGVVLISTTRREVVESETPYRRIASDICRHEIKMLVHLSGMERRTLLLGLSDHRISE